MYKTVNQYKTPFLVFILILGSLLVFSQTSSSTLTSKSKKAVKLYTKAQEAHKQMDMDAVMMYLQEAVKQDPGFIEAYLYLGEVAKDRKMNDIAIESFRKAIEIDPNFFPSVFLPLADLEFMNGDYTEARIHYIGYLDNARYNEAREKQLKWKIENCNFAIGAMANPMEFNPENLGSNINTSDDEYVNDIATDGTRLFFTKKFRGDGIYPDGSPVYTEDFFYSIKDDKLLWDEAVSLGPPINTKGKEGAMNIAPDGSIIFFSGCYQDRGLGSCDLYQSKKVNNNWSRPVNLGDKINSKQWDTHPSLSADGNTLYFTSSRTGRKGKSDLWYSTKDENGVWGSPVNLGDSINTPGLEMSPVIHPDGATLYFASDGHFGMGGLDLYVSRKNTKGEWTAPVNLGYPINTNADELGLVVDAEGRYAYFSSDKLGGEGKYDIYRFELPEIARPVPVTYMKGVVYDKETEKRLHADFQLVDLETGEVVIRADSDPVNGEFLVAIPTDRTYALSVDAKDYLFYSENIDVRGRFDQMEPMVQNIPLQSLKAGSQVVLRNIFFETDSYALKPESKLELEKLLQLLNDNERMKIEIGGHTDNVGGLEYNIELSGNRAEAVVDFLISKGISAARLTHKGYAYSEPIDDNTTSEGRARNRRTEFKVVDF